MSAHEISPAIATLEATRAGGVRVDILLDLEAAIAGIAPGHEETLTEEASTRYEQLRARTPAELRAAFDTIADQLLLRIVLTRDSQARAETLRLISLEVPEVGDPTLPRRSKLTLEAMPSDLHNPILWHLDPLLGDSVIRLRDPDSKKILGAQLLTAGETSSPISMSEWQEAHWSSVFTRYLAIGFKHILPYGADHILFIVGLFLLSTRLAPLLAQITAFTVAHTLTLALSMLDIVRLSATVVEPLIALSIVYVAVENITTDRMHRWRVAVVFAFGLLHGLGFAGLLQDIGAAPDQFLTSLIAFNVGVELGQLAVIGLCLVAVFWCVKRSWYRPRVVIPASSVIALVGAFWLFERVGVF